MKLTLAVITLTIGMWVAWPALADEPMELEGVAGPVVVADADSVLITPEQWEAIIREMDRAVVEVHPVYVYPPPSPPRLVTWAELDSVLAEMRRVEDKTEELQREWGTAWVVEHLLGGGYHAHPAWLAPTFQGPPYCGVTVGEGR